jgi:3-hydroxybutyryl-CoA dehydrogenase
MPGVDIQSVGILGAGTMGHGIAQVAAMAGCDVVLADVTAARAEEGIAQLSRNLEAGVRKGKVTAEAAEAARARVRAAEGLAPLGGCDLVIEAIPEDMGLKQRVFRELSALVRPEAVLASNTSSLSLTEMASAATGPQRVVGLHFFNPVHVMKLLEVVRAYQTDEQTLASVRAFGKRLGKELVEVRDSPGFASSRLGIALGMEAIRMVEEGVASPADIDRAMELGYGHPMGPLKLTDLVGLDVRLAIAEHLHRELGNPAFRPPQLLKQMVRAGRLGKKAGRGFYTYTGD